MATKKLTCGCVTAVSVEILILVIFIQYIPNGSLIRIIGKYTKGFFFFFLDDFVLHKANGWGDTLFCEDACRRVTILEF